MAMPADASYRDIVGACIQNPLGCEYPAWYLNVLAVTEPDPDGFIKVHAVEGTVVVISDMNWHSLELTPELADLVETLLVDEAHRFEGR